MLEFINETHTYILDGVIIPSVSQILACLFPDKYKGVPEYILERKAGYGSAIHDAIYEIESGYEEPVLDFIKKLSIDQWYRLKRKYEIEVISQEQMVNYEQFYAGRFDMIARIKGKRCLCDIKTTAELDEEYLSWQLSYYELAMEEEFDSLYAIWLPKKGLGKLIEIKRKTKEELLEGIEKFNKEFGDNWYK